MGASEREARGLVVKIGNREGVCAMTCITSRANKLLLVRVIFCMTALTGRLKSAEYLPGRTRSKRFFRMARDAGGFDMPAGEGEIGLIVIKAG